MMTINVPSTFNGSPIPDLAVVYNFKRYTFRAGESWKIEDEEAAKHIINTYPFVKRMGDLKNIKTYSPESVGNPDYLKNKYLGQEKEDNGILDGDYPGIETESI